MLYITLGLVPGGDLFMNEQPKRSTKKSDAEDWMKEVVTLSLCYDFYGELLNEHHRLIFEEYILNDMSLSEISEETGISRQGVYDIVKRCSKKLHEYEDKLGLIERFHTLQQKVSDMDRIIDEIAKTDVEERMKVYISKLRELAQQVQEDL